MTVEEGHVIDLDGGGTTTTTKNGDSKALNSEIKYKFDGGPETPVIGGDLVEDGGGATKWGDDDAASVNSKGSDRSRTTSQLEAAAKLPWYRGVTCKDVRYSLNMRIRFPLLTSRQCVISSGTLCQP